MEDAPHPRMLHDPNPGELLNSRTSASQLTALQQGARLGPHCVTPPSDVPSSDDLLSAAAPCILSPLNRQVESLRIEPLVEFHRSSSGRNIRLKHVSAGNILSSPHGLTPRAPDRRRPLCEPTPPSRPRSMSANSPPKFVLDQQDKGIDGDTERHDNQAVSIPRSTGKQENSVSEDRRSSFSISEKALHALGYVRSATPEHSDQNQESDASVSSSEEEENGEGKDEQANSSIVSSPDKEDRDGYHLDEENVLEEKPETPLIPASTAKTQPDATRPVYQFDLWKNAAKNRKLADAISVQDIPQALQSSQPVKAVSPRRAECIPRRRSWEDTPLHLVDNPHAQQAVGDRDRERMQSACEMVLKVHNDQQPGVSEKRASARGLLINPEESKERMSQRSEIWLTRSASPTIGGNRAAGSRSNSTSALQRQVPAVEPDNAIVHWKRGELIGEGTFGKVYMGLNIDTGEMFALKEIEVRISASADQMKQIQKLGEEIELMHNLSHKHIVRYKGSLRTEQFFYIFMEYIPGGSIASMLKQFDAFSEDLVRIFTRQIVAGVVYLHKMGIVHRDIKGANVLVTEQGVSKLADFGCSKQLPQIITTSLEESLRSIRGSVPWMAPEVVKQTGHGFKADIWSIGATVIEMATGCHPWPASTNSLAAMYTIAKATSSPPIPSHLSADAAAFLQRCFCIDPEERATAVELAQHAFLSER